MLTPPTAPTPLHSLVHLSITLVSTLNDFQNVIKYNDETKYFSRKNDICINTDMKFRVESGINITSLVSG